MLVCGRREGEMRTSQPQETHGGILTGGCHLIYNDIQGPKQAVNIICNQQTHKHGRPVILKRSSFSPFFQTTMGYTWQGLYKFTNWGEENKQKTFPSMKCQSPRSGCIFFRYSHKIRPVSVNQGTKGQAALPRHGEVCHINIPVALCLPLAPVEQLTGPSYGF